MKTPIMIINFKTYRQATGKSALRLAKDCEAVAKSAGVSVAVAVQAADIYHICHKVKIHVLAQHIDPIDYGAHTGDTLAEDVRDNGAVGTLLNHSEHRLRLDVLEQSVKEAKEAGLMTVVCANTPHTAEAVAAFGPDFIAVEPPELIGGDVSVSTAKPEVVTKTVELVHKVNPKIRVLCGAGVKTQDDVKKALELGTVGVLLASGVTKADNPKRTLKELAKGLI